jgi:hypothetical protein
MSQAKFKIAVPVITVIGAIFGLHIIGTFGMIIAKAGQFSS